MQLDSLFSFRLNGLEEGQIGLAGEFVLEYGLIVEGEPLSIGSAR